jgi:FkbM family methyltransferase
MHFKWLQANLALNETKNVVPIKKALYKYDGTVSFKPQSGGASRVKNHGKLAVECISLASLIDEADINRQKIKFIKLDVEGAELELADELIEFVREHPNCVVAIASYHKAGEKPSYWHIENKADVYREILIKTMFPYHLTTYLINKNSQNYRKFKRLLLNRAI